MPIQIDDTALDRSVEALAARQPSPLAKTTFARAVLRRAVEACEVSEDPLAWMPATVNPTNGQQTGDPAQPLIPGRTDPVHPEKDVEDMTSSDSAAKCPPATA